MWDLRCEMNATRECLSRIAYPIYPIRLLSISCFSLSGSRGEGPANLCGASLKAGFSGPGQIQVALPTEGLEPKAPGEDVFCLSVFTLYPVP
jgi:hypothetical protein